MPLAWLHDYLERRRIRRNGNRRVLDERFGDPDITAPMAETEKTPLEPVNERHHTPVPVPVPVQPTVPTKSKKSRKNKRAVTEELVPSDEDLFG
ncbi:hypothetical protein HCDG_00794 [Histoplasma capsulatum H143]|uniref:Uncharacterized protein n=1 Tax=Ajellomyces capsulatus (strain H143) TaxID=544712 RepID=C6H262_AJECH|nr:hypothetical protein HCDG_00794 [Histoplasma capsulatum H143]